MRRRPTPPQEDEAVKILGLPKPTDMSASIRAQSPDGVAFGSARHNPPWTVLLVLKRGVLHAALKVNGRPILNLDHHAFEARGGIEVGYHWDVRPPLVSEDRRIGSTRQDPQGLKMAARHLGKTLKSSESNPSTNAGGCSEALKLPKTPDCN